MCLLYEAAMPTNALRTFSTSFSSRTGRISVARNEQARQTKIPKDEMVSGYINAPQPALTKSCDVAPITSAAHEASANEPNRSEPMPATYHNRPTALIRLPQQTEH